MIRAVQCSNVDAVRLLLELGANANVSTSLGETALHFVAMTGNIPIANMLLENGADVNALTSYGTTPLSQAFVFGQLPIYNLLRSKQASDSMLNQFGEPLGTFATTQWQQNAQSLRLTRNSPTPLVSNFAIQA